MDFDHLFQSDTIRLTFIGQGTSGTIFGIEVHKFDEENSRFLSTSYVFKKGSSSPSLWTDFNLTNRAHNAVNNIESSLANMLIHQNLLIPRVPAAYAFRLSHGEMKAESRKFPSPWQGPRTRFTETRIPSVPVAMQRDIVEAFGAEDSGPDGDHCLIRVYLGERRTRKSKKEGCHYGTLN